MKNNYDVLFKKHFDRIPVPIFDLAKIRRETEKQPIQNQENFIKMLAQKYKEQRGIQ